MAYTVEVLPGAARELRKLPAKTRNALLLRLVSFREDPRPHGSKKLEGPGNLWRIREEDYRLVYQIRDTKVLVLVVRTGHRREVYTRLSRLPKNLAE